MTAAWRQVDFHTSTGHRVLADVRDGGGSPLLLLPGTWGNARIRGPMVERLDAGLTLVCAALPGQDANWPPAADPSIPLFSELAAELADHLELDRPVVAGHSLGGMIAIDMLRFGPDRLRGAAAIEGWTHHAVKQAAFNGDVSSTQNDLQRVLLAEARAELVGRWPPAQREQFGAVWQQWDGWDILESTSLPVLEIWGDRGRGRPTREVMRIPARENIELAWIENASHSLLVEAPGRVADLLNRFVKSTDN